MVQMGFDEIVSVNIATIIQWIALGVFVLGILMVIFGIVLAVYLKKKEKKKKE